MRVHSQFNGLRRRIMLRGNKPLVAGLLLIAFLLPPVLPPYVLSVVILALIFGILAMSLDILMGYTGLESLGQAAFFGTAAYSVGILVVRHHVDWFVAAALGLLLSTVIAAVFGLLAVRLGGNYFLLITLAFGQVLWGGVLRWGSVTGGYNGFPGIPRPLATLSSPLTFYYFTLVVYIVCAALIYRIISSPFGLGLQGIRDRELRLVTLGFSTFTHKYLAFVIAGFFSGISGLLGATYNGFVSPHDLSLRLSFEAMLMVIVGGAGSIIGPAIGAVLITALRYFISVYIENYWVLVLGVIFMLTALYLPGGIIGWLRSRRHERSVEAAPASNSPGAGGVAQLAHEFQSTAQARHNRRSADQHAERRPVLCLRSIGKSYGNLRVLDDVSLVFHPGERVGIIGPNGAGKTTLFNVISGIQSPTTGQIELFGQDVTRLRANKRTAIGLARTFQITSLCPSLTAFENVALALFGWPYREHKYALHVPVCRMEEIRERAGQLLEYVGLWAYRDVEVRHLAYGHQRQLEVALALASEPRVLLLDEPMAGLSPAEIGPMITLLRSLPRDLTLVLIEHNLGAIFELVDRMVVLHHGQVLADGSREEVKENLEVQQIYFGRRRVAAVEPRQLDQQR